MTRLIIDASLPERLARLNQPVELCDASGRVLGRFFLHLDPIEYRLEPQITSAELKRRQQSNEKTYTTAEVLDVLKKL